MFEQEKNVKKKVEAKPKKSNVYKVNVSVNTDPKNPDNDPVETVAYVRAKTKAGAEKIAKEAAVAVTAVAALPTQDELLRLANVAVMNEVA